MFNVVDALLFIFFFYFLFSFRLFFCFKEENISTFIVALYAEIKFLHFLPFLYLLSFFVTFVKERKGTFDVPCFVFFFSFFLFAEIKSNSKHASGTFSLPRTREKDQNGRKSTTRSMLLEVEEAERREREKSSQNSGSFINRIMLTTRGVRRWDRKEIRVQTRLNLLNQTGWISLTPCSSSFALCMTLFHLPSSSSFPRQSIFLLPSFLLPFFLSSLLSPSMHVTRP